MKELKQLAENYIALFEHLYSMHGLSKKRIELISFIEKQRGNEVQATLQFFEELQNSNFKVGSVKNTAEILSFIQSFLPSLSMVGEADIPKILKHYGFGGSMNNFFFPWFFVLKHIHDNYDFDHETLTDMYVLVSLSIYISAEIKTSEMLGFGSNPTNMISAINRRFRELNRIPKKIDAKRPLDKIYSLSEESFLLALKGIYSSGKTTEPKLLFITELIYLRYRAFLYDSGINMTYKEVLKSFYPLLALTRRQLEYPLDKEKFDELRHQSADSFSSFRAQKMRDFVNESNRVTSDTAFLKFTKDQAHS